MASNYFAEFGSQQIFASPLDLLLMSVQKWTCPDFAPPHVLIYAVVLSNAKGLFLPNVECLRRGILAYSKMWVSILHPAQYP